MALYVVDLGYFLNTVFHRKDVSQLQTYMYIYGSSFTVQQGIGVGSGEETDRGLNSPVKMWSGSMRLPPHLKDENPLFAFSAKNVKNLHWFYLKFAQYVIYEIASKDLLIFNICLNF